MGWLGWRGLVGERLIPGPVNAVPGSAEQVVTSGRCLDQDLTLALTACLMVIFFSVCLASFSFRSTTTSRMPLS